MKIKKGIIYNFNFELLSEYISYKIEKLDFKNTPYGDSPDIFLINEAMLLIPRYLQNGFVFDNKAVLYTLKDFSVENLLILSPSLPSIIENSEYTLKTIIPSSLLPSSNEKESFFKGRFIPPFLNLKVPQSLDDIFSDSFIVKKNIIATNFLYPELLNKNQTSSFVDMNPIQQISLSIELKILPFPVFFEASKPIMYFRVNFFAAVSSIINLFLKSKLIIDDSFFQDIDNIAKLGLIPDDYKDL